ncbi:hypothetical protein [Halomicrobium katesii]|uniref:hypothetical protein n=1 Tax=Halomicrobium katesii TaxID=437163 RepID=UPI000362609E|nr:hypothetical protein [Halomicrobium katesii]
MRISDIVGTTGRYTAKKTVLWSLRSSLATVASPKNAATGVSTTVPAPAYGQVPDCSAAVSTRSMATT